jgi:SAM-dependent methyltransferase
MLAAAILAAAVLTPTAGAQQVYLWRPHRGDSNNRSQTTSLAAPVPRPRAKQAWHALERTFARGDDLSSAAPCASSVCIADEGEHEVCVCNAPDDDGDIAWTSLPDGRTVEALEGAYRMGIEPPAGGAGTSHGATAEATVAYVCDGRTAGAPMAVLWAGAPSAGLRLAMPAWMRADPTPARRRSRLLGAVEAGNAARLVVGVPALCGAGGLDQPEWLRRYESIFARTSESAYGVGDGVRGDDDDARRIYGEISTRGALRLLARLRALGGVTDSDGEEVVYDLGSGEGRLVLLAALSSASGGGRRSARRAVGIEVDPRRHALAEAHLRRGVERGLISAQEAARVVLARGDAFAAGAFRDATVVYMLNTAFDESIHARFLASVGPGPEKSPRLRWIVVAKPFSAEALERHARSGGSAVRLHDRMTVSTNWNPELPLLLYRVEARTGSVVCNSGEHLVTVGP